MLRPGFLGLLADWTTHFLEIHPRDLDTAMRIFGLKDKLKHIGERTKDRDKLVGTFSEWLVFDHQSPAFGGKTGLAYFCGRNPLDLPDIKLAAYRDLLDFSVGYFEVADVSPAQYVRLRNMEGTEYDVADVSTSMAVAKGETIWARIARVQGIYQMVGSVIYQAPFTYQPGMKKAILSWGKNAADAKHITDMVYGDRHTNRGGDTPVGIGDEMPEEKAAEQFDKALEAAGMAEMISSKTVKKWADNEKKFPIGFPMKAVFFLLPEQLEEQGRDAVLQALQTYLVNLPRKSLMGKTPLEASAEQKAEDRHLEIDIYGYEDYADEVRSANSLMPNDPKEAYKAYEQLVKRLLEEKVPLVTAFRIFCNAGLCLLQLDENQSDPLGVELIRTSLRINPLYDFGLRQKERLIDPLYDLSQIPKEERSFVEALRSLAEASGVRRYRRSIFRKYEGFLKDAGISLTYKAFSEVTSWRTDEEGNTIKIGRNDPCYCGSGKKFKKCCGR